MKYFILIILFLFIDCNVNNWAILVCTSRFWFNYRHVSNTLSFYHIIKKNGIPDSNIILMLADDMSCNARNPFPGKMFNNMKKDINLYDENIQVDYRNYEVTVESFLRVLLNKHDKDVPWNKRINTDENSNILIFMSGHGGNNFLKFQDSEEISSEDLSNAFEEMHQMKRYKSILFIADTCQAGSLLNFKSPNIISIGSSKLGQNSYSHHHDPKLGVAVIDRFTYFTLEFFKNSYNSTLKELTSYFQPSFVYSDIEVKSNIDLNIPLKNYFSNQIKFVESNDEYELVQ